MTFHGQAKKRGGSSDDGIVVPVLAPSDQVTMVMESLRRRQNHSTLSNVKTSRRYQSFLSRYIANTPPWKQCRKVHSLRGIYACMVFRVFEWGCHSSAFVTMCVLGHNGLNESLVYTPFHLGRDFGEEPSLGNGYFTEWSPDSPQTSRPSSVSEKASSSSPT